MKFFDPVSTFNIIILCLYIYIYCKLQHLKKLNYDCTKLKSKKLFYSAFIVENNTLLFRDKHSLTGNNIIKKYGLNSIIILALLYIKC